MCAHLIEQKLALFSIINRVPSAPLNKSIIGTFDAKSYQKFNCHRASLEIPSTSRKLAIRELPECPTKLTISANCVRSCVPKATKRDNSDKNLTDTGNFKKKYEKEEFKLFLQNIERFCPFYADNFQERMTKSQNVFTFLESNNKKVFIGLNAMTTFHLKLPGVILLVNTTTMNELWQETRSKIEIIKSSSNSMVHCARYLWIIGFQNPKGNIKL
ncbi:hypothetical protein BpHYR1_023917 [Brachionus plicatilis]|uniref:Uncharacterized protein n=1 Tax=Brachionus plicatilis TaxID=10195 RepID=A0A3M7R5J0_BRAPC|nr:hypothetical protein BpHYR1_023917 [Brachionus plicatilis]